MAVSIREIRPGDVEAAIAAVREAGGEVERPRVVTQLSVVACEDKPGDATATPLGVALCVRGEGGEVVLYVAFPDKEPDPALVRELVGKAVTKARSAHIFACRVRMLSELPAGSDPLSTGSNWYERFAREHAA